MKVRLEDQRIVFRLSEDDRESLMKNKTITSSIVLESSILSFTIELDKSIQSLSIEGKDGLTKVYMPESYMGKWDEVKVGFEEEMKYTNGNSLSLIIEKDLKRSKRRDR